MKEFLDVDFNDCQAGVEEVLSLRIVSAPLVHASNVPWRAVLMMATCVLNADSSEAECLEIFGCLQRIIETECLEAIAAPLPVLNGVEVRSALASHLGREVAPGCVSLSHRGCLNFEPLGFCCPLDWRWLKLLGMFDHGRPIIGLLVQKVFDFQIKHSIDLAKGQPRLPQAAGDDTEANSAAGNQAEAGAAAAIRNQVNQLVFTDSVTREACIKSILQDDDVKAELDRAAARAAAGSKKKKKR